MAAERILVVEDDDAIRSHLVRILGSAGYRSDSAASAREAMTTFEAALATGDRYSLVMLDLGLPDGDGINVCQALVAADAAVKVLILTARADEIDIVMGLDSGAADYVTKPFRLAELMARVRAQLRDPSPDRVIEHAGLRVDIDARRVWRDGTEVELRAQEFDLLAVLAINAGRAVSRQQLMRDAWDENW